ncbi:hypothetical protein AB0F43_32045 [Kribbella sp. NPDC023972]|uniref:hypothetical protein n=1 Tax=Kribbella sp. NPDC023972 TaxID=3154795 RepID=UPI0033E01B39
MPLPTFVPAENPHPRARILNRTQTAARLGINGPGVDKLVRAGMLSVPIELEEVERLAGRPRLQVAAGELTVLRTDARAEADPAKHPHDTRKWIGFHVQHSDDELADSSLRWWRSVPERVIDNTLFAVTVATLPVAVYAISSPKVASFQYPGEPFVRHHYAGQLLARAHPRMVVTYPQDTRDDLRDLARQIMNSTIRVDSGGPIGYLEPAPLP